MPFGNVVGNSGTATAPTAGSAVATIPASSLPAGWYRCWAVTQMSGTAETLPINWKFYSSGGAATPTISFASLGTAVNTVPLGDVYCDGSAALKIGAVATAAAGIVYSGTLFAQRVY